MTTKTDTQALGLSFEYFPVNSDNARARLEQAVQRHSRFRPDFLSVTYGAGGTTQERTLATLASIRRNYDTPLAGHLTCIGKSKRDVLDMAGAYEAIGVRNIVALRGDLPDGEAGLRADGFRYASELVEALASRGFHVRVAAYPETHPEARSEADDIDNLKRKFDAGASEALTQFFFEKDVFLRFRDKAVAAGIEKPIVPGIFPIEDFAKLKNFAKLCKANLPDWLHAGFENARTDEDKALFSTAVSSSLIENLRAEGVDKFHIYTMNNPKLVDDLLTAIGREVELPTIAKVA